MKAILDLLKTEGPGTSAADIVKANILQRNRTQKEALKFAAEWLLELELRGLAYSSGAYYWKAKAR